MNEKILWDFFLDYDHSGAMLRWRKTGKNWNAKYCGKNRLTRLCNVKIADRETVFYAGKIAHNCKSAPIYRCFTITILSATVAILPLLTFLPTVAALVDEEDFPTVSSAPVKAPSRQNSVDLSRLFSDVSRTVSGIGTILGGNGATRNANRNSSPLLQSDSGINNEGPMRGENAGAPQETESTLPFASLFGGSNVCFRTCGMEDIQFAARRAGEMFVTLKVCIVILTIVMVACTLAFTVIGLYFLLNRYRIPAKKTTDDDSDYDSYDYNKNNNKQKVNENNSNADGTVNYRKHAANYDKRERATSTPSTTSCGSDTMDGSAQHGRDGAPRGARHRPLDATRYCRGASPPPLPCLPARFPLPVEQPAVSRGVLTGDSTSRLHCSGHYCGGDFCADAFDGANSLISSACGDTPPNTIVTPKHIVKN